MSRTVLRLLPGLPRLHSFPSRHKLNALLRSTLVLLLVSLQAFPASAWVFPEHRDIAALAMQKLDADRQARLQALWTEARTGHEQRLCAQNSDPTQSSCIDFAAW